MRDHLANERTLLVWQRTALRVIAIGFLMDRLALEDAGSAVAESFLGIATVVLGAVVSVVGPFRFVRTERGMDSQTYRPALLAHLASTATIVSGTFALVLYLAATLDQRPSLRRVGIRSSGMPSSRCRNGGVRAPRPGTTGWP